VESGWKRCGPQTMDRRWTRSDTWVVFDPWSRRGKKRHRPAIREDPSKGPAVTALPI